MENRKLVELTVSELDETGIDIISFVEDPAIEVDFMYFSKEKKEVFKSYNDEKRIVTGAAMIPNDKIVRLDADGNEYDVFFSEQTVRDCQELFFKKGNITATNVDHEDNDSVTSGITVVESWIVEDPNNDKSKHLGFKDILKGSWFVSYKVDDNTLWDKIKSGEVKGFSVEGMFTQNIAKETQLEKMSKVLDSCISNLDKLLELEKINMKHVSNL